MLMNTFMGWSQCSRLQNFLPKTHKSVGYVKIQSKAGRIVIELVIFANKAWGLEFKP